MKQIKSLLTAGLLICSAISYCQVNPSDTGMPSEKAERFKKVLSGYLSEKAVYPQEALSDHTWGDVILTCELGREGKFSEPLIKKSPDLLLSSYSIVTMDNLDKLWETEKPDYFQTGLEYLFIFRYRIYMNAMPVDNKARAMKLYNMSKFEKAVKAFDRAIKDNEYDHELYRFRAVCKEHLGDSEGAGDDYVKADNLSKEVMAVIDVIKLGQSYSVRISGSRIEKVPAPPR